MCQGNYFCISQAKRGVVSICFVGSANKLQALTPTHSAKKFAIGFLKLHPSLHPLILIPDIALYHIMLMLWIINIYAHQCALRKWCCRHDVRPFTQTWYLAPQNLYFSQHKGTYPDNGQDNQEVCKYSKQSCVDTWPEIWASYRKTPSSFLLTMPFWYLILSCMSKK